MLRRGTRLDKTERSTSSFYYFPKKVCILRVIRSSLVLHRRQDLLWNTTGGTDDGTRNIDASFMGAFYVLNQICSCAYSFD